MKHIIILLCLFTLGSCSDSNNLVEKTQQGEILNLDKSDFVNQTGYVQLILDKASAQEWKDHYIKTTTENEGHEFLNQYRLNAITNMIERSDFLFTVKENDAQFLMKMYTDYDTKGGLEIKHLMLNKLSEFYPDEEITSLRNEAYKKGLQYQEKFKIKLEEYKKRTKADEGQDWRDMTVESYQAKVDDANNFLHFFEPNS